MRVRKVLLAFLANFVLAMPVNADQVIYQPGPAPGVDVWINNTYSYNSDYGVDDDKLQTGGWGDLYHFLIKFDLTGLPQVATSAQLLMVPYSAGGSSMLVGMPIDLMTTNWDENTGWYNTVLSGTQVGTLPAPTLGYWYGITFTGIYNGWKTGTYPNYGFRFRASGNNNQFTQFRSSDYSYKPHRPKLVVTYDGANLRFPLQGTIPAGQPNAGMQYGPYTAPISSVFDHDMDVPYSKSNPSSVVAYNGEKGSIVYPTDDTCVKKASGQAFVINGAYVGSSDCGGKFYLSYEGHSGIDYRVDFGTPVYAAANGTIDGWNGSFDCPTNGVSCSGYGRMVIHHPSGYTTWYVHLSKQVGGLVPGSAVNKGQLIGYSGQTTPPGQPTIGAHLHFEVLKDNGTLRGMPVDPYGWTGNYKDDPYYSVGHQWIINAKLWE